MASTIPHLSVPLRLSGSAFAIDEQGTEEEIASCVYALIATPRGSRIEEPDYGVEDPDFRPLPLDVSEWIEQARIWEPRAELVTRQDVEDTLAMIEVAVMPV